jgi:NAD(P)H-dependent FMN reductase
MLPPCAMLLLVELDVVVELLPLSEPLALPETELGEDEDGGAIEAEVLELGDEEDEVLALEDGLEDEDEGLVEDMLLLEGLVVVTDELLDDDGLAERLELLERVLAADLVISLTAVHAVNVPTALAAAFVFLSAAQTTLTTSPAFTSLRVATALPCTGRVVLLAVVVLMDDGDPAAAASRTVIVLDEASTETTSTTSAPLALVVACASVRAWVLLSLAADSDSDELPAGLTAGDFSVAGLWACSAEAMPAARTRPSRMVAFFMFPPVVRCAGRGPASGRLTPERRVV